MKQSEIHKLFDGLSAEEMDGHAKQDRRYSTQEKQALEARRLPVVFAGVNTPPAGFCDVPATRTILAVPAAEGLRTAVVGFVQKLVARHVSPV